ncbi:hypothetical protein OH77DRAFT_1317112 [Trametes cingulata]|nr:hypothetical protein OH77DRAFT_1317112 [Trametes cingulata]
MLGMKTGVCLDDHTDVESHPSSDSESDDWENLVPRDVLYDPELRRRNIILRMVLKPDVVFQTAIEDGPNYVVKALNLATEELPIYQRLLSDLECPANHTVPSEILHSRKPYLIMPVLDGLTTYMRSAHKSLRFRLLRVFHEFVEGIEYLHDLHIAHLVSAAYLLSDFIRKNAHIYSRLCTLQSCGSSIAWSQFR